MNDKVEVSSVECISAEMGLQSRLNREREKERNNRFSSMILTYIKSNNVFIELLNPAVCR